MSEKTERKGIALAGSMIVDISYPIEVYPEESELVVVNDGIEYSTGGLVCNCITDLARLDPKLPLQAIGLIGDDTEGDLIAEKLGRFENIDMSHVKRTGKSSVTIVMNNTKSKKRTFFQYHGNNGYFDESYIDWDSISADILHVGYILLLDALDESDPEYGTRMARLLAHAKEHGIKTSIDVVTETGTRLKEKVPPALKFTDYCVINESEAQQVTGIVLRDDLGLHPENMEKALKRLKELGVSTWAVIHCPEGGYGLDENNEYTELASLCLPEGFIKGAVGAGDAFCAGVLYGAEKSFGLRDAINLGICAAAAALSEQSATDGLRAIDEVLELESKYGRRS